MLVYCFLVLGVACERWLPVNSVLWHVRPGTPSDTTAATTATSHTHKRAHTHTHTHHLFSVRVPHAIHLARFGKRVSVASSLLDFLRKIYVILPTRKKMSTLCCLDELRNAHLRVTWSRREGHILNFIAHASACPQSHEIFNFHPMTQSSALVSLVHLCQLMLSTLQ